MATTPVSKAETRGYSSTKDQLQKLTRSELRARWTGVRTAGSLMGARRPR